MVACANRAARELGVREGQAVAAAKAIAGELRVVARDPASERTALEGIAGWAGQFTPMVCIEEQGILLEVSSSLRLFQGHARIASAVRQGIRELGFRAAMGVAPTPLAARLFARAQAEGKPVRGCLTVEDLPQRLGELPLFLLDWPGQSIAHLTDLGMVRLRDVLALPVEGVARRFGPPAALSIEKLMGRIADPRSAYAPPPRFRTRLELPAEADGVEALLFPLRRMLVQLEGFARGRGCGVQRLVIWLEHARRQRTRLPLEFASPEREADFILAIARERLGRLQLTGPTLALDLRAEALLEYTPRDATWLPGAAEQKLDALHLVERLAARLGDERVFGIAVAPDHRPERGWRTDASRTAPSRKESAAPPAGRGGRPPTRPTWLLHNPVKLIATEAGPQLQGELEINSGPERIEAGWWDGAEVRRDYYVATNPRGESVLVISRGRSAAAVDPIMPAR